MEEEPEYEDGYGSDLMGDEEDRAALGAMTELERELELADRGEARDREIERRRAARLAQQRQAVAERVGEEGLGV